MISASFGAVVGYPIWSTLITAAGGAADARPATARPACVPATRTACPAGARHAARADPALVAVTAPAAQLMPASPLARTAVAVTTGTTMRRRTLTG
jgi:hypothetical protein